MCGATGPRPVECSKGGDGGCPPTLEPYGTPGLLREQRQPDRATTPRTARASLITPGPSRRVCGADRRTATPRKTPIFWSPSFVLVLLRCPWSNGPAAARRSPQWSFSQVRQRSGRLALSAACRSWTMPLLLFSGEYVGELTSQTSKPPGP